jgi:hypothetical protein
MAGTPPALRALLGQGGCERRSATMAAVAVSFAPLALYVVLAGGNH